MLRWERLYPELLKNVALVKGIVASEEERFSTTLDNGRVYLDEALAALSEGAVLPGDVAFSCTTPLVSPSI